MKNSLENKKQKYKNDKQSKDYKYALKIVKRQQQYLQKLNKLGADQRKPYFRF